MSKYGDDYPGKHQTVEDQLGASRLLKADRTKISDDKRYHARPSDPSKLSSAGHSLQNDLQVAAAEGNTEMVKMLLENGVDVNALGGEGGALWWWRCY